MIRIFILLSWFQLSHSFLLKDFFNKIIDKFQNESVSNNGIGLSYIQKDLSIKYQQAANLTNLNECIPNSIAYNGTCIYFSSQNQKLSWIQAEKFCRSLPLNTSLLVIENQHQLEFIRRKLIQIKEIEKPIDDLIFYIGYKYVMNEWKWINNKTVIQRKKFTLGKCGGIVLLNDSIVMRSGSCENTNSRFACEYTIDSCYENKCLNQGKCINLVGTFYCDCPILYRGNLCEKLNSKFIQLIVACVIALLFLIIILTKRITLIYLFLKNLSKLISLDKFKLKKSIKPIEMINSFRLILKVVLIVFLVQIQTIFIHSWSLFGRFHILSFKQYHLITNFCFLFETYYLFLELFYFGLFIIFFIFYIILSNFKLISATNHNRFLASIIYIAYTYDIIKMFFYYLTSDKKLPFISNLDGIITDFIIQILHIILIGFKFFPLLICLDLNHIVSDLFCFSYSSIIWVLDLSTRTFCIDNSKTYLDKFKTFWNITNKFNTNSVIIDLIENVPIYVCLSFLVISYFLTLIDRVIKLYFGSNDKKKVDSIVCFSRQFFCLYSVAFMIIYYLNAIGLRLTILFGKDLVNLINFSLQSLFKQSKPLITNLYSELLLTSLLTTSFISIQLILNIKAFRNDLIELSAKKDKLLEYLKLNPNEYSSVILNALHYPGYLIAHLICSYLIFCFLIFSFIIFSKLVQYLPFKVLIQIFLPFFLVLFFRIVVLKYLERILFSKFSNMSFYYVYSYFNFFSDCLLGLISCLSRTWKTNLIAIIMLPRLDKTIFNNQNSFILSILDRGHYCYLNFVKKELLFN